MGKSFSSFRAVKLEYRAGVLNAHLSLDTNPEPFSRTFSSWGSPLALLKFWIQSILHIHLTVLSTVIVELHPPAFPPLPAPFLPSLVCVCDHLIVSSSLTPHS